MSKKCPYEKKCGGCQYIDLPYEEQLKKKQKDTKKARRAYTLRAFVQEIKYWKTTII